ncbi:MAG: hypothetical protein U0640_05375 [Phycisphaerales bacterium]
MKQKFEHEQSRARDAGNKTLKALSSGEILLEDAYGTGISKAKPGRKRKSKKKARSGVSKRHRLQKFLKSPIEKTGTKQTVVSRIDAKCFPQSIELIDRERVFDRRRKCDLVCVQAVSAHVKKYVEHLKAIQGPINPRTAWRSRVKFNGTRLVVCTYYYRGPTIIIEADRFSESTSIQSMGKYVAFE